MKTNYQIFLFSVVLMMASLVSFGQQKPNKHLIILQESERAPLQKGQELLEQRLNLPDQNTFTLEDEAIDKIGFVHRKYQQSYKGVKVEFGKAILNARANQVVSMNNNVFEIEDISVNPSVSRSAAFQTALSFVGGNKYLWEEADELVIAGNYNKPEGELVVFPAIKNISETARLAYKFDIYSTDPVYRAEIYVDASTGEFIFENKRIHHADVPATGESLYNGTVSFTADDSSGPYRLRQTADGDGIQTYDMNNGTNYANATDITSNSTTFNHATGVQAHFGAEQTHKYYLQTHGRNSFNNAGAVIRSYVSYGNNYVNAFWDGSRMTYGDGDGVNYGPLVSLDIVGHEITHGVTEYSANLIYSYQSGALNESFSDIFGESIENFGSGTNDWLMGDQIGAGGSGGALRSMSNPNAYGDPDTYLGTNWYFGSGDNGGVHYNSGVQNFWFYLLTVGGTGSNDNGDNYSVTGLGMSKAAAIAYRNLTVYLSSNSQYADARAGAIQAAIDLYGAGSPEEVATTNAWYAVGVGAAYDDGPPPPETCETGDIYLSLTFDNYPEETGWNLKNSAGTTIASDRYTRSNPDGSTVTRTFTGLSIDDYTFTITDSYGDGICCAYGSGSYTLSSDAGVIYSGGSFGSSEATNFCIDDGSTEPDTEAPTTPTGLVASNITQTTATLNWNGSTDNVGVTGYEVFQGSTSVAIVTATSLDISGLTEDTGYTYNVVAFDEAGNTSGQASVTFTTLTTEPDTEAPTTPTGLVASNITQTTATLNWNGSTDNVGVTGYEVFQGSTSVAIVTATSLDISGLTEDTGYTYNVVAFDEAGNTSGQASVTFTTLASGGGSDILHTGTFESGWDGWQDGGSDSYRYRGSRSYEGSYSIRLRDNTNSSTMTLAGFDLSAYSSIDIEFYFYAYSMELGEDFWLQFYDGSSWNTVASYARGTDFNNSTFYTSNVIINSSEYAFPSDAAFRFRCDASGNADYVYIDQVTISANGGNSVAGVTIASMGSPAGFVDLSADDQEFESEDFVLYPNPVRSDLTIALVDLDESFSYRILNLNGQTVMRGKLTQQRLNVQSLQKGVYFFEVSDGEELMIKRFIKE